MTTARAAGLSDLPTSESVAQSRQSVSQIGLPGPPSAWLTAGGTTIEAWYGLRYATATRFGPSKSAHGRLPDAGLRDVPIFPQRPSRLAAAMGNGPSHAQSEDAFFANVWAPSGADNLPVLLFIHGGAWMTGGATEWYDGRVLASKGLVVVTVNYRLGALGHLGWAEASALPLPADDLLQALRWVSDHIRNFGGDPARITVAGQSAGGWYAHLLSLLPETRGLVYRVSLLSTATRQPWSAERQAEIMRRTVEQLGGADVASAPLDALLDASIKGLGTEPPALGYASSAFLPVATFGVPARLLDPAWSAQTCHAQAVHLRNTADESAAFFFMSPLYRQAQQAQVDAALSLWDSVDLPPSLKRDGIYIGVNSGLSPYRQLVAASSWRQFQRFSTEYATALTTEGKNVQLILFREESELPGLHSGHCFDLPFQFGVRAAWDDAPMLRGFDNDRFKAVSQNLVSELAAFAIGDTTNPAKRK